MEECAWDLCSAWAAAHRSRRSGNMQGSPGSRRLWRSSGLTAATWSAMLPMLRMFRTRNARGLRAEHGGGAPIGAAGGRDRAVWLHRLQGSSGLHCRAWSAMLPMLRMFRTKLRVVFVQSMGAASRSVRLGRSGRIIRKMPMVTFGRTVCAWTGAATGPDYHVEISQKDRRCRSPPRTRLPAPGAVTARRSPHRGTVAT